MIDQQLLSLSEASERYNIPIPTLRAAVQRGDIVGRKVGNQWVVVAQSVEDFRLNPPKMGRPPKTEN